MSAVANDIKPINDIGVKKPAMSAAAAYQWRRHLVSVSGYGGNLNIHQSITACQPMTA